MNETYRKHYKLQADLIWDVGHWRTAQIHDMRTEGGKRSSQNEKEYLSVDQLISLKKAQTFLTIISSCLLQKSLKNCYIYNNFGWIFTKTVNYFSFVVSENQRD